MRNLGYALWPGIIAPRFGLEWGAAPRRLIEPQLFVLFEGIRLTGKMASAMAQRGCPRQAWGADGRG